MLNWLISKRPAQTWSWRKKTRNASRSFLKKTSSPAWRQNSIIPPVRWREKKLPAARPLLMRHAWSSEPTVPASVLPGAGWQIRSSTHRRMVSSLLVTWKKVPRFRRDCRFSLWQIHGPSGSRPTWMNPCCRGWTSAKRRSSPSVLP